MPHEFDGVDDSLLETFLINNGIIVDLIKETDQPEANNAKLVIKLANVNG